MSTNNTKNHHEVFTALALLVNQIFKKKCIFLVYKKQDFSVKKSYKIKYPLFTNDYKSKKTNFQAYFSKILSNM